MWGDDRDHAARTEQQPATPSLPDGIGCFLAYLGTISKNDGLLAHTTTDDTREAFQRLLQGWGRLAVVPVDDLEK